ncbi:MAG: Gfo/Idh/MocA family protein [Candidatus Zipacnadales bacterium]
MAQKVNQVRAGVIGAGIGKFHIQGFLNHPKAECIALCDLNATLAQEVANRFGVPHVFTDYKEMLKLEGLNAVSVCVPNALHRPIAVDCLNAGMHVLCEKPLSVNAAEGQKIVDAAQKAGRTLMMQFNNRYRPEAKLLKRYIDAGELGDIYFARCGWIRRNGIPGWGSWFTTKKMAGGGPLIDLAVHMLDLTMYLMGNPEPTLCMAATYSVFGPKMQALGPWGTPNREGKFDVEDMAVGMIRFAGGQSILLEASWASRIKREWVYSTLMGTKAGASLERVFGFDGDDDSSIDTLEIFTQEYGADEQGTPVNRQLIVKPDPAMGRTNAVEHFCECLIAGKEPISPGTDGLRIMRILDAMYQSAKTGKAVNVK